MSVSWFIALKFFFARRKYNAINIISGVSVLSVATVTAAILCVLSVMNGFEEVIKDMCCQFDPEYKIIPKTGKYVFANDSIVTMLSQIDGVEYVSRVIEEEALIRYKDFQTGARLMGVDDNFQKMTRIDSLITDGFYSVYDGAFERTVLGRGLAHTVGTNAHFVDGIRIYVPKRNKKVNLIDVSDNVVSKTVYIAGTFAVNQAKYDDEIMCISLNLARELFELDSNTVSFLGIKMTQGSRIKTIKQSVLALFNNSVFIQNQYEQQEDFYKMVRVEKMLTAFLLFFILLIASFNIISSLYMVILDKEETIKTFFVLGMDIVSVRRVFFLEGWLISIFGGGIGLTIGCALCFLQDRFGLLKIGTGQNYVLSAYPVNLEMTDVLITFALVCLLGMAMAYVPTHKIKTVKQYS